MNPRTTELPVARSRRGVAKDVESRALAGATIAVPANRIIRGLFVVAVLFLILDLIIQTIDHRSEPGYIFWPHLVRFVDLNAESSLPTWFSVMLLALAAVLTLSIGLLQLREGEKFARHWLLLALLVTGFSIDEGSQIHDSPDGLPLRDVVGTSGIFHYAWVIPALISAIVFGLIFLRFLIALPRRTRLFFILSALVFASGAIGLEMLAGWYADRHPDANLTWETMSSFEEFLEMSGVILLVAGLLDYANRYVGETRLRWLPVNLPAGK